MCYPDLDRFERDLSSELAGHLPIRYLRHLETHSHLFRQFDSWRDATAFMHSMSMSGADKNDILRAILFCQARMFRRAQQAVLVAMFLPALRKNWSVRLWWEKSDTEELWHRLLSCFLGAIAWLRRSRRREHLAGALMRQTLHLFYEDAQRRRRIRSHEKQPEANPETGEDPIEALLEPVDDPNFQRVELRQAQEACCAGLKDLWHRGIIDGVEYHLMVGTLIYQKSLAEYAREHGLPVEGAKKRRQRALQRICKFREESGRHVSPSDPLGGLFLGEG